MLTFQEIYEREVVLLPFADRLRLATLILQDVSKSPTMPLADESTEWSEEDLQDLSRESRRRFMEIDDDAVVDYR